jgi:hypothetical protein
MNAVAFRLADVAFLVLYVREAHPGQHICIHRDAAQKAAPARVAAEE